MAMMGSGPAVRRTGDGSGGKAVNNPLLGCEPVSANGILVNITAGGFHDARIRRSAAPSRSTPETRPMVWAPCWTRICRTRSASPSWPPASTVLWHRPVRRNLAPAASGASAGNPGAVHVPTRQRPAANCVAAAIPSTRPALRWSAGNAAAAIDYLDIPSFLRPADDGVPCRAPTGSAAIRVPMGRIGPSFQGGDISGGASDAAGTRHRHRQSDSMMLQKETKLWGICRKRVSRARRCAIVQRV